MMNLVFISEFEFFGFEQVLCGFYGVIFIFVCFEVMRDFLMQVFFFEVVGSDGDIECFVFLLGQVFDVELGIEFGCGGVGMVYYIVFCVFDDEIEFVWQVYLCVYGVLVFLVMDWQYFYLIYFCELGGVFFEIVIDFLGFIVDEEFEFFGQLFKLLVGFESCRQEIEMQLLFF